LQNFFAQSLILQLDSQQPEDGVGPPWLKALTREAPTISGAKNESCGHGKVLLREQHKDQQMWKHFPCNLPNFEGCKRATFSAYSKTEPDSFLFTFPKVARLHSVFSLYHFFVQNKRN
jgi:hypothetical protein